MAPIRRFEDIEGWKKSRALYQRFSQASSSPAFRSRDLRDQMRRSAESAMSNIAEGFDSGSNPEFVRFLKISDRSLSEFQSHLYVCKDERFLSDRVFDELYEMAREARTKVGAFIRYLKAHPRGKKCCFPNELRTPNEPRTPNELGTRNPELFKTPQG